MLGQHPQSTETLVEPIPETPFYIPATGTSPRPRRSLKHGDCFAVLDSFGDIGATHGGPDGLFYLDTRHLGQLELSINGMQPLLLGSNMRDDNSMLTVDLTNPDFYFDDRLVLPKDTLHIVRTLFLWNGDRLPAALHPQPRRPRRAPDPVAEICQRLRGSVRGARPAARASRQWERRRARAKRGRAELSGTGCEAAAYGADVRSGAGGVVAHRSHLSARAGTR